MKNIILSSKIVSLIIINLIYSSERDYDYTINVTYSAVACSCAQWKVENKKTTEYIYLERANNDILDANHIWDGKTLPLKLIIKGHFKKELGIPKNFNSKGRPELGKVFLYKDIKIIK